MSPFDEAPDFFELDNRQHRTLNPVTKQQLHNKHEVLFPRGIVEGKRILDLGCALGATGHWCLAQGAAHYTGVEVQKEYADTAEALLGKYHPGKYSIVQKSIEEYLETSADQFDIISLLGVIYAFTDYFSILKAVAARTRETIIVEGLYPDTGQFPKDFCGVQFITRQNINLAKENASLVGRGTRLSPKGLEFIMEELGFATREGLLYPTPITESPDPYNKPIDHMSSRYLLRFDRTPYKPLSLSEDLQGPQSGMHASW